MEALRMTEAQKEYLVDYISANTFLNSVLAKSPEEINLYNQKWEELTSNLNAIKGGSVKTSNKWQMAWGYSKLYLKTKLGKINSANIQTNDEKIILTPIEEKLLSFLSKESSELTVDLLESANGEKSQDQESLQITPHDLINCGVILFNDSELDSDSSSECEIQKRKMKITNEELVIILKNKNRVLENIGESIDLLKTSQNKIAESLKKITLMCDINDLKKMLNSDSKKMKKPNLSKDESETKNEILSSEENQINKVISIYKNLTINSKLSDINSSIKSDVTKKNRKIFLVRHGERVDMTFGSWISFSFDENGKYIRKDLNMPRWLPERKDAPDGFEFDTPLTNIGLLQATLTGEAMQDASLTFQHVFCSPSLRCVQTCDNILKALNNGKQSPIPIKIEPGFFEWMQWHPTGIPNWMSLEELNEAGYNIDKNYIPEISKENLSDYLLENCEEMYIRSYQVMKAKIDKTKNEGGNILVVAHASTLEVCSRQVVGKNPRSTGEMLKILYKVPFCSVAMLESNENDNKWELKQPPFPTFEQNNVRFDWKTLIDN